MEEWLSKSSWALEDEDEEEAEEDGEVEEEKPFPVVSSVLLVHRQTKVVLFTFKFFIYFYLLFII
jgi:hypothetical protein